MQYPIIKNVPLPESGARQAAMRAKKYPFDTMEPGECFFVEGKRKNTFTTRTSVAAKKLGRKFASRLVYMREKNGNWSLCGPDVPGAKQGVGVWRVE